MIYTKAKNTNEVSKREQENLVLSRLVASEAIVLLENDGVLPLKRRDVALYGFGASMTIKGGTGSGEVKERYCVSILEGLINNGFTITSLDWIREYEELYTSLRKEYVTKKRKSFNIFKINKIWDQLTDDFKNPLGRIINDEDAVKSNTDTCIYVLSRQAGEGKDRKVEKGSYLLLDDELEMIRKCASSFSKFILIINVGSSIDLSEIKKIDGINAILYISQLGCEGGNAVADVLSGKVNPSGKLSNTWVNNYQDIPNGENFGPCGIDKDNLKYIENIFVGYRYYDSFDINVAYPFGYGLSYTKFLVNYKDKYIDKNNISLLINVKNIGEYPGSEVVQLYLKKPSKRLKQPKQVLIDFIKSNVIDSHSEEDLTITFNILDYASYDEKNASYILEAGDYIISIGTNVSNTKDCFCIKIEEDIVVSQHQNICPLDIEMKKIEIDNHFQSLGFECYQLDLSSIEVKNYCYDYQYQYSERAYQFVKNLKVKEMVDLVVGAGMFFDNSKFVLPGAVGNTTSKLWDKGLANIAFCDGPAGIRLLKTSGINKKGKIKAFDSTLSSYEFLPKIVNKIMNANPKKYRPIYQFTTSFPVANALAQTWNKELMNRVGKAIQKEMEEYGCTYWLAPAINIQLNPLCGRNFEYFSEEPILAGKLAAEIIKGVQSKEGFYVTVKHFACNNQETNRETVNAHVDERTLREIYLKAFEICVKEGKAKGIMTSYNKINGVYTPNSYDLCTKVLRCEWGFNGVVMTDWYSTRGDHADNVLAIKAGNDLIMPGGFTMAKHQIKKALRKKKLSKEELFNACYNVVNSIMNSQIQKEYIDKTK